MATIVAGIFLGKGTFIVLLFIIAFLCSFELIGILLPKEETNLRKHLFGVLISMTPCLYIYATYQEWIPQHIPLIGLLGIIGSAVFLVELFSFSKKPFETSGSIIITLIYIGVPLALMIDLAESLVTYAPGLMFSIFFFTWANDTGAYFIGSWFGKNKLYERISPKKTIEGLIGGIIVSVIAAIAISFIWDMLTSTQWIILSIIVAITATLGDLVESMLKRSIDIKDSGTWLPGHGGFMDRFDGFVFAIPFAYFYIQLFV